MTTVDLFHRAAFVTSTHTHTLKVLSFQNNMKFSKEREIFIEDKKEKVFYEPFACHKERKIFYFSFFFHFSDDWTVIFFII